jgi:hypothetical protein
MFTSQKLRPEGRLGVLPGVGPAVTELTRLQPDTARAVDHVRRLDRADQEIAVDLRTASAGSQAWNARQPARPGLPHLATYCADDAADSTPPQAIHITPQAVYGNALISPAALIAAWRDVRLAGWGGSYSDGD